ncbi:hypothetical protein NQ830_12245 [Clostridioides difficile]|uniref:hypothetical protein n=1 Tax=Clostridioides difficile TaxID=1496 RepID=UPI00038D9C2F|nr:hypothetical protein [Clostridioides difficile]EQJ88656.1 hypothetical protein QUC_3316 [Clostridioides difficile P50]MCO8835429.1 hypothetical protein [Clostridioides difficile]MCP8337698.1 hypothetical protein [Clostridioides difficile]MCR1410101.1 hypothetical protein [Clostridioides difficile]MCR1421090.1 hypothetical protein [Clostridioides difficile]
MEDCYVFEVIENFTDERIHFDYENTHFCKGDKFIGHISKSGSGGDVVVKMFCLEIINIPLNLVKKIYKVEFKEVK